jgi:hypothetical protein
MTTDATRPRVAARDVVKEIPESQARGIVIGVVEFMSQLDSLHTQGLDEHNFGHGDT